MRAMRLYRGVAQGYAVLPTASVGCRTYRTGNREWGVGNGESGMGNGEWGSTGIGSLRFPLLGTRSRGAVMNTLTLCQQSGRPHYDLDAWKESRKLVSAIYRVTQAFPKDEMFGLIAQMRRAAVSVPSNIAEGAARTGSREYVQF